MIALNILLYLKVTLSIRVKDKRTHVTRIYDIYNKTHVES